MLLRSVLVICTTFSLGVQSTTSKSEPYQSTTTGDLKNATATTASFLATNGPVTRYPTRLSVETTQMLLETTSSTKGWPSLKDVILNEENRPTQKDMKRAQASKVKKRKKKKKLKRIQGMANDRPIPDPTPSTTTEIHMNIVEPDDSMTDYEWNEDNIKIDFMTGKHSIFSTHFLRD